MKIALAFFGLPRCTPATWPSIEQGLIAPLAAQGELKVFHHLFMQDRVSNMRSKEDHALAPANYEPFHAFEGEFEKPEDCVRHLPIAQAMAFGDAWRDGFASLRNLMLQLHSLYRVTARLTPWQPDVVVFARPDMVYHDGIAVADVERAASDPLAVMLPWWQWWGGFNDRFAICGRKAAVVYGRRLIVAPLFCRQLRRPLHAESLLGTTLQSYGAQVTPIPMRATRVRVDGRLEDEDFSVSVQARLILERRGPPGP